MKHTFEGFVVMHTQRAILFQSHYWESPEWMPRSQIEYNRCWDTGEVTVVASSWICGQKDLREFEYREEQEPYVG